MSLPQSASLNLPVSQERKPVAVGSGIVSTCPLNVNVKQEMEHLAKKTKPVLFFLEM